MKPNSLEEEYKKHSKARNIYIIIYYHKSGLWWLEANEIKWNAANARHSWSLAKAMWKFRQFKEESSVVRAILAINALLLARGCCEAV